MWLSSAVKSSGINLHIAAAACTLLQIIGVGASVIGDMSSRPNWGLNELDFVFSTLVVHMSDL